MDPFNLEPRGFRSWNIFGGYVSATVVPPVDFVLSL